MELGTAFRQYFENFSPAQSAAMIQRRRSENTRYGSTPLNQGRLEVGTLIGVLANTPRDILYPCAYLLRSRIDLIRHPRRAGDFRVSGYVRNYESALRSSYHAGNLPPPVLNLAGGPSRSCIRRRFPIHPRGHHTRGYFFPPQRHGGPKTDGSEAQRRRSLGRRRQRFPAKAVPEA